MDTYETELGYLEYDGASDRLSIPVRLRERHLDQEVRTCYLQGIGPELQVAIWSERDDIIIRIPLLEWISDDIKQGTLTGANDGILSVGRYEDAIANDGDIVEAEIRTHGLEEI